MPRGASAQIRSHSRKEHQITTTLHEQNLQTLLEDAEERGFAVREELEELDLAPEELEELTDALEARGVELRAVEEDDDEFCDRRVCYDFDEDIYFYQGEARAGVVVGF